MAKDHNTAVAAGKWMTTSRFDTPTLIRDTRKRTFGCAFLYSTLLSSPFINNAYIPSMHIRLHKQLCAPFGALTQSLLEGWLAQPDTLGMSTTIMRTQNPTLTIQPNTFCWFRRDGDPTPEPFWDHLNTETAALAGAFTQDPTLLLTAQHLLPSLGKRQPPERWAFLLFNGGGILFKPTESFLPLKHIPTKKQKAAFLSSMETSIFPLVHQTSAHTRLQTLETLQMLSLHFVSRAWQNLFHIPTPSFTIHLH